MPEHGKLLDRVVVVTGAAGGLGRAIAHRAAAEGARLGLLGPHAEPLDALARELGAERSEPLLCDITDDGQVTAAAERLRARFGRCDVLVNNAAVIDPPRPLAEMDSATWQRTVDVNLTGALRCTREFGSAMIEAGSGVIVNVTSIAARSPNSSPAYTASKGGLLALTRQTAVEWGPLGVRCNAVSPGFVRTAMSEVIYADEDLTTLRTAVTPLRRISEPEDVAGVVVFLGGEDGAFVNGEEIVVDGGFLTAAMMNVQTRSSQYGGREAPLLER